MHSPRRKENPLMKPSSVLAAVLCSVLAGAALAQPAGQPKFDFTVRPKLVPRPDRPSRDTSKVMTGPEARALAKDLFVSYQNIGSLARFRFHKRTKDEAPMTADELGWVETELKDEMALAEKLAPEAETALKTGIEREPPLKFKHPSLAGLRIAGMVKLKSSKPTYEDYRRAEHNTMGGLMLGLHELVNAAADREEVTKEDAKYVAESRQRVSAPIGPPAMVRRAAAPPRVRTRFARAPACATAGRGSLRKKPLVRPTRWNSAPRT